MSSSSDGTEMKATMDSRMDSDSLPHSLHQYAIEIKAFNMASPYNQLQKGVSQVSTTSYLTKLFDACVSISLHKHLCKWAYLSKTLEGFEAIVMSLVKTLPEVWPLEFSSPDKFLPSLSDVLHCNQNTKQ